MDDETLFDASLFDAFDEDAKRLNIKPIRIRGAMDEARGFYGWTAHKLDIFELYLKNYVRVAGGGTYIDAFAGTGQISVNEVLRRGSAGVASGAGAFKSLRFYEVEPNASQLEEWFDATLTEKVRARCVVRHGDCNDLIPQDLDAGVIDKDKPCFALLDPDSTQLHWSTVVRLAKYKTPADPPHRCKVELWILLNTYQVLMRLLGTKPHYEILDRWFGERAAWWDLYQRGSTAPMYALRYAELLKGLGYGAAVPMLIADPTTRRPQYHMIHASDHRAAHSLMSWSSKRAGEVKLAPPTLW